LFNATGSVLGNFLNDCKPQANYLLGRMANPIILNGDAVLSVGNSLKLVGSHRIATNILFFNKEGAKFVKVVGESVQIPFIIGDVGIIALVSTVNWNYLAI
jgi:hypothetical protein